MSAQRASAPAIDPLVITYKQIDAALHEVDGDPREAIRNLLPDLAVMALDGDAASSRDVKGRFSSGARRAQAADAI
ncbi:hypothetical protein ABIE41_002133 [Bosea sp. OAE506]|uniref:hypothetical protein n=1 Tax=Bosea sp. OAE506 TaxID=2663870 RepID=UPI00178ADF9A